MFNEPTVTPPQIMAITSATCTSYLKEIPTGVHTDLDTYKIALYSNAATLSAATTAYSATNEITGDGYTAGGMDMAGFTIGENGGVVWVDFTTDPEWSSSSITAYGALIYNSSKSNKAVCVLDFGGAITSTGGKFKVQIPTPDDTNALIRFSPAA